VFRQAFRHFWPILLTTILIRFIDPFGINAALEERCGFVLARAWALFYPIFAVDAPEQRVTVILIDDGFINSPDLPKTAPRLSWPIAFDKYAKLIRDIKEHKPASIFVNVLFNAERDGESQLLEALTEPGAPVILADDIKAGTPRQCDDGRKLPYGTILLPLACAARTVAAIETEPEAGTYVAQVPGGCGLWLTPAFAQRELERNPDSNALKCNTNALPREPIFLPWSYEISEAMARMDGNERCRFAPGRGLPVWVEKVEIFLYAIFPGFEQRFDARDKCISIDTLNASQVVGQPSRILGPAGDNSVVDEKKCEVPNAITDDIQVSCLLHHRHILIGATAAIGNDVVLSPVHGKVAGVYYHAVALETLLNYPDRLMDVSDGTVAGVAREKLVSSLLVAVWVILTWTFEAILPLLLQDPFVLRSTWIRLPLRSVAWLCSGWLVRWVLFGLVIAALVRFADLHTVPGLIAWLLEGPVEYIVHKIYPHKTEFSEAGATAGSDAGSDLVGTEESP
jgi:hypothetical protein